MGPAINRREAQVEVTKAFGGEQRPSRLRVFGGDLASLSVAFSITVEGVDADRHFFLRSLVLKRPSATAFRRVSPKNE